MISLGVVNVTIKLVDGIILHVIVTIDGFPLGNQNGIR